VQYCHRRSHRWAGKLADQDDGKKHRGRELSDSGAKARFYNAVCEAQLSHIIQVDKAAQQFIDESARTLAGRMDGKLRLVSNVQDLFPEEIVARYKSLADIERGFKVLKSELEIGPVYHRLPEWIRVHAAICFKALMSCAVVYVLLTPG
jgi:transposase